MNTIAVNLHQRGFDLFPGRALSQVIQHKQGAHEQGSRIGKAFSGDVWRSAVDSFKHGAVVADVRAGNDAEPANESSGEVAHDVTIKIGQQKHVELERIHDNLHAGVVHDEFFVLNFGKLGGHGANGAQEQAVRELHDVGLVDGVNLFAAVAARVIEAKAGDARGSPFGNDFQAFHNSRDYFVLEAGV